MTYLEPLEKRRLFAGVTIITHGYADNSQGWESTMADAIGRAAGGLSTVAIYTLYLAKDPDGTVSPYDMEHEAGTATMTSATSGETIIKLDWGGISTGQVTSTAVGDAVASWLMQPNSDLPGLDELPIHLIGHSRGASVNSEIARDLGEHNIWVDQFTGLDPHPIDGDEPVELWSNIAFADTYWRSGGGTNSAPVGKAVDGAYNVHLSVLDTNYSNAESPHVATHAWYFGTIDQGATSDGDGVNIPSDWYGTAAAEPARNQTGFYYSLIEGGVRPGSGIAKSQGGTAARVSVAATGAQWADVGSLSLSSHSVKRGKSVTLDFNYQNPLGKSKVVYFLADDENPYDNSTRDVISHGTLATAENVTAKSVKVSTAGIAAGKYYVGEKIIGAGGVIRYAYAETRLFVK
jgi:hypothetical protein